MTYRLNNRVVEYEIIKQGGELAASNVYWVDTGEALEGEDLDTLHALILSRLDEQWDEMRNAFWNEYSPESEGV